MARILFICLGNICRSPIAEGVMRSLSADRDIEVESAGTSSWHAGDPPDERAQRVAARRGYDLSQLRGRQVSENDFHEFDLIVAMDRSNVSKLKKIAPNNGRARIALLLDFAADNERQGMQEIPDPYYGEFAFDSVIDLVEAGCRGILRDLDN